MKVKALRAETAQGMPHDERRFYLNPEHFEVEFEGNYPTLVMKNVMTEPLDSAPFHEDFVQWMKDRGLEQDAILEAVYEEVESQQLVRLLSARLRGR